MGRKNILLTSFAIFLIAYLGFALTQNIILIAALFFFYGAYLGVCRAVGKAFASDFVPEHLRASRIGWYITTVGLLQLVASVVAGLLWDRVGHGAIFLYGAGFAVVGSVGLLVLHPRNRTTHCAIERSVALRLTSKPKISFANQHVSTQCTLLSDLERVQSGHIEAPNSPKRS